MTNKQIVWMSFDLGVRGDFEGLYAWLEQHGAKECGASVAAFEYEHDGANLAQKLKADLLDNVTFDKRARVYVVYRDKAAKKNRGRFIIGSRRAPPWTGYAPTGEADDDEG